MTTVSMPTLGLTMKEGMIVEWFRKPGESFKEGDPLFSVETDKAVLEVEAESDGMLLEVMVPAGGVAAVGVPIATIRTPRDEGGAAPVAGGVPSQAGAGVPAPAAAVPQPSAMPLPSASPGSSPASPERVLISPAARKAAAQAGIAVTSLSGSGPNGRIILRDLPRAGATPAPRAEAPAPRAGRWTALTPMRRAIVASVRQSSQVPQFRVTHTVDLTRLMALRAALAPYWTRDGVSVSLTDFFLAACAIALAEYPGVNAGFEEGPGGAGIRQHGAVNIACAMEVEGGLLAPVISGVDALSLPGIAGARAGLHASVRSGTLGVQDIAVAGFMISNLGPLGIDQFDAMVMPPQAAVLAVGRVANRVLADAEGTSAVRPTVILTLTADHRVIDGALAARFLGKICSVLEQAEAFRLF